MLHYMRSLLPGYPDNPLFEAIFIDLLPANARDAAVKHDSMEDMAKAADKVLAEAPPTTTMVTAAISCALSPCPRTPVDVARVTRDGPPSSPHTPSRKAQARDSSLCYIHVRYGKAAFKCATPSSCRMRDVLAKPDTPASGNYNAGCQ